MVDRARGTIRGGFIGDANLAGTKHRRPRFRLHHRRDQPAGMRVTARVFGRASTFIGCSVMLLRAALVGPRMLPLGPGDQQNGHRPEDSRVPDTKTHHPAHIVHRRPDVNREITRPPFVFARSVLNTLAPHIIIIV